MIIISPGQALLILLHQLTNDHTTIDDKQTIITLKKLYWLGVQSEEDQRLINLFFKDPMLAHYETKGDPDVIQQDSARRYFETCLAKETLANTLDLLPIEKLQQLYKELDNLLSEVLDHSAYTNKITTKEVIQAVLDGRVEILATETLPPREIEQYIKNNYSHLYYNSDAIREMFLGEIKKYINAYSDLCYEYSDAITRIHSSEIENIFDDQSLNDNMKAIFQNKIRLLIQIAFLTNRIVVHDQKDKTNKILRELYEDFSGPFQTKRGRRERETIEHKDQPRSCSRQPGIMTSTMPPVTTIETTSPTTRIPDRSTFDLDSDGAKNCFNRQTLPFITGISGTTLCLVRCLQYLHSQNKLCFANDNQETLQLEYFMKCFFSALLYLNGGHSFYEFLETLTLEQVKTCCSFITEPARLSLESLFFMGKENQRVFDSALNKTMTYHNILLNKQRLHQELQTVFDSIPRRTMDNIILNKKSFQLNLQIFFFKKFPISFTNRTISSYDWLSNKKRDHSQRVPLAEASLLRQ